jgi:hypothetical protein
MSATQIQYKSMLILMCMHMQKITDRMWVGLVNRIYISHSCMHAENSGYGFCLQKKAHNSQFIASRRGYVHLRKSLSLRLRYH